MADDEKGKGQLVNVNIDLGEVGPGLVKLANRAMGGVATVYSDGRSVMNRLFGGAIDQTGALMTEGIRRIRAANLEKIGAAAIPMLPPGEVQMHPRLLGKLANEGSWASDDHMQKQWAGLVAASVSADGGDEKNLMFMDLLSRITSPQARLMEFACKRADLVVSPAGIIAARPKAFTLRAVREVSGVDDILELDRYVDHLRSLELLDHAAGIELLHEDDFDRQIPKEEPPVRLHPSSLGIQFYIRCQGWRGSPAEFAGLEFKPSTR